MPLLVLITALNGVAEELFFRGALYAATTALPGAVTTVAYAAATLATGNVMLAFAAVLLGPLVGLQRRATGGILAPIITHVIWSVTMLFAAARRSSADDPVDVRPLGARRSSSARRTASA